MLFPVVTLIIMETFISKMRRMKGERKLILLEEAWKAISKEGMAEYMRYLFKTVRKFFGQAMVVTQEIEDIISSPIVKETIINNSDCKILLDQRKYLNKFDAIQAMLGLTDKERAQILSINTANNPSRRYKEVWIGLGGTQSAVYATEVSPEEYYCYTTDETEKLEVQRLTERLGGDIELAIRQLAESKRQGQMWIEEWDREQRRRQRDEPEVPRLAELTEESERLLRNRDIEALTGLVKRWRLSEDVIRMVGAQVERAQLVRRPEDTAEGKTAKLMEALRDTRYFRAEGARLAELGIAFRDERN